MAPAEHSCNVDEILAVIVRATDRAERASGDEFFDIFDFEKWERDRSGQYCDSITDVSVMSISASDLPSEHTRDTTIDNSEVVSDAPSNDLDQDDNLQDMRGSNQDHGRASGHQSSLDPAPLLIPVLRDEHKRLTMVDMPRTLPPFGGLVASEVHLRSSRFLAPRPGAPITSWNHGSPPRPGVSQRRSPRPRTVVDPKKTAEVRAKGSCQRCGILKVRCDVDERCARCGRWDAENHDRVCDRTDVVAILRSGRVSILDGGRWTAERTQLASRPARDPFPITVHFAPSSWQGLHIRVAEHADGNYRIHPGCSAFEAEILKWAESDLGNASSGNFQRSLEAFLCLYSRRNCVEKKSLVDSVVEVSSLWRLISASQLCYGDSQSRKPLPDYIANQLKCYAQRTMSTAEEKAIQEIGNLIPTAFTNDSDIPVVWAALWSMILIYRQALHMVASGTVAFKDNFREVTSRLLDALIVALSGHYRTRRVLEILDKAALPSSEDRAMEPCFLRYDDIKNAYHQARLERNGFYNEVQTSQFHGDDLIRAHVVKQEQDVMGRKRSKGRKSDVVALFY